MTVTQLVIIVAGLFFGYRLVSHLLSPGTGEDRHESRPSGDRADSGGDAPKHAPHRACSDASASETSPAWYRTLKVAESASQAEIDQAYRVQISQYHPDKVARLGEDIRRLAEVRSSEINAAYDVAVRLRRGSSMRSD